MHENPNSFFKLNSEEENIKELQKSNYSIMILIALITLNLGILIIHNFLTKFFNEPMESLKCGNH